MESPGRVWSLSHAFQPRRWGSLALRGEVWGKCTHAGIFSVPRGLRSGDWDHWGREGVARGREKGCALCLGPTNARELGSDRFNKCDLREWLEG